MKEPSFDMFQSKLETVLKNEMKQQLLRREKEEKI